MRDPTGGMPRILLTAIGESKSMDPAKARPDRPVTIGCNESCNQSPKVPPCPREISFAPLLLALATTARSEGRTVRRF